MSTTPRRLIQISDIHLREEPVHVGPTLMVFRENVVLYSEAGALPPEIFTNLIDQVKGVDMEDVHRQIAEHQASEGDHEGHDHD